MKKNSVSIIWLALIVAACGGSDAVGRAGDPGDTDPPPSGPPNMGPNIVVIVTDDQRADSVATFMPRTYQRIFQEGMTFSNAFVTTPLCGPSRGSILTGQYARHHGLIRNSGLLMEGGVATFAWLLKDAGYRTGSIGKYLNAWNGDARPWEWDFWAHEFHGYENPSFNINGVRTQREPGYITHRQRDFAVQFLEEAAADTVRPFLLYLNFHAAHHPSTPAPGDEGLYAGRAFAPPNFNELDVSDKPAWLQARSFIDARDARRTRAKMLATLHSVDEAVDVILNKLEALEVLDTTFILFLSDNGFAWGEHRLGGKNFVYEESVRVPFAIRFPPLAVGGLVESRLVANIDIAPTLYELAGVPIPPGVDGASLLGLVNGGAGWRTHILLEGFTNFNRRGLDTPPWSAVHTGESVYVETDGDRPEYYRLRSDPFQLDNLADSNDPSVQSEITTLRGLLGSGL